MPAGWPTYYAWACCPKDISTPKPSGPCGMSCANARHLVRQQTANVLSLQNILVRNTGVRLSAKRMHALTQEELEAPAAQSRPGPGGHQQSCRPGLPEPTDQNAGTSRPAASEAHACLRAVADGRWHWDDFGPDDHAGNGRYWPLSHGGATMLRTVAVSRVRKSATGSGKARAMSKMATRIWRGPIWRRPSLPSASTRRCSGFTNGNKPKANVMVARKTVAHKLARACYYIMRDLVPFDVHKAFG